MAQTLHIKALDLNMVDKSQPAKVKFDFISLLLSLKYAQFLKTKDVK